MCPLMDFILSNMEFIILVVVFLGFAGLAIYLKQPKSDNEDQIELKDSRISILEKELVCIPVGWWLEEIDLKYMIDTILNTI